MAEVRLTFHYCLIQGIELLMPMGCTILLYKSDGIPHAAVYVIDKAGIVRWARIEANFRERPSNENIRAALDNLR